jgi:hypothetical protein
VIQSLAEQACDDLKVSHLTAMKTGYHGQTWRITAHMRPGPWLKLRIREIEGTIVQDTLDLHEILVLDGIDPMILQCHCRKF